MMISSPLAARSTNGTSLFSRNGYGRGRLFVRGQFQLVPVGIAQVNRLRNGMILKFKLNSTGPQTFLGLQEVDPVHLEGDVPHDGGGAAIRRRTDLAASLE